MNRISLIFAVVALAFVAFGCRSCETIDSSKLDPSEIYQEYSVTVSDSTSVSAEFRVSGSTGTTIALVAPSKVEHNGKSMSGNVRTIFSGTYYSAETSGFTGSHTFVFTDSSGREFKNSLEFEPIKIAVERIDLSKAAKSISIPLSRGLTDGESVSISLRSEVEPPKPPANATNANAMAPSGPDYSNDLRGSVDNDTKTFTFDTGQLRNFISGKANLSISLSGSRKPADVGIRGGRIYYTINSPAINGTVTN